MPHSKCANCTVFIILSTRYTSARAAAAAAPVTYTAPLRIGAGLVLSHPYLCTHFIFNPISARTSTPKFSLVTEREARALLAPRLPHSEQPNVTKHEVYIRHTKRRRRRNGRIVCKHIHSSAYYSLLQTRPLAALNRYSEKRFPSTWWPPPWNGGHASSSSGNACACQRWKSRTDNGLTGAGVRGWRNVVA